MNDGLDIPVHTPGAPAAASALERVAEASDRIGTSVERSAVGTARLSQTFEALGRAANTFNEIHATLATFTGMVDVAVNRVTALASEEQALQEMSARLGLDFDQAAASAGRFADETTAMGVAGRAAASDIRLTQTELDAVMRLSGAKARELGTTVQGAAEMLTDALVRGREGGLQRFGQGLSELAGEGHTMQERLAGVVAEASRTAAATDSAADAVERYKDSLEDAQRTAATAFVTELARIQAFTTATRGATSDADELKVKMQAVGQTAAYILTQLGNVAQVAVGVIGVAMAPLLTGLDVAAAGIAALSSDGPAAAARAMAAAAQEGRTSQAFRVAGDGLRGFRDAYNASNTERTTAAPEAAAATAGGGTGRGSDMTFGTDEATQILGRNRRRRGGGDPFAEMRADKAAQLQEQAAEAANIERSAAALRADAVARSEAEAAAEAAMRRDIATQALSDQVQQARAIAANEDANLRASIERHERYTGRLAEIYQQRVDLTQIAAESTQFAFNSLAGAFGNAVNAVAQEGKTAGDAAQEMLSGVLSTIGKEASVKGAFYAAQSLGNLAVGNLPGAGAAAAASVGFFAVAGIAGYAAHEAKPDAAKAGAGGGQRAADVSPRRSDSGGGGGMTIVQNYYAPTFGGREGTEAEIGVRFDRYDDAARARLQRRAA